MDKITTCLHPIRVRNPSTKETMILPCGKCTACRLAKSLYYTTLCRTESFLHTNTYFVTLTYSDKYLPRASFVPRETNKGDENDRFDLVDTDNGLIISECGCDFSTVYKLQRKVKSEYIPYLQKYDVQLFLKRLRKQMSAYKIRYFAVGEYGPKHFRPHYHLLLWFDTDPSELCKSISEKWPFGRVDVQKAKGDCAKYVAGYTSSFSFVPPVLYGSVANPFSLHSQRLGYDYFFRYFGFKIYGREYSDLERASITDNGNFREIPVPRSFKASCWPKPRGFCRLADEDSYRALTMYRYCRKDIPLKYEAANIVTYVRRYYRDRVYTIGYERIINHYYETSGCLNGLTYDQQLGVVYRDLLTSKRFCMIAQCKYFRDQVGIYFGQYSNSYRALFADVRKYYDFRELYTLSLFYQNQNSLLSKYDDIETNFFYDQDLFVSTLSEKVAYKRYETAIAQRFADSTKHKVQNDLNRILYG